MKSIKFAICVIWGLFLFVNPVWSTTEGREEIEKHAEDKLESCFENIGLGLVEIGIGAFQFSKGDPVGAAAGIGLGIRDIRDGVNDFKEAKEGFERIRDIDREMNYSRDNTNETTGIGTDREY